MIIFISVYIVGYIIALLLSIKRSLNLYEEIDIGDMINIMLLSTFSWVVVIFLAVTYLEESKILNIVILKKKEV